MIQNQVKNQSIKTKPRNERNSRKCKKEHQRSYYYKPSLFVQLSRGKRAHEEKKEIYEKDKNRAS